jgi:hypothetical protein
MGLGCWARPFRAKELAGYYHHTTEFRWEVPGCGTQVLLVPVVPSARFQGASHILVYVLGILTLMSLILVHLIYLTLLHEDAALITCYTVEPEFPARIAV